MKIKLLIGLGVAIISTYLATQTVLANGFHAVVSNMVVASTQHDAGATTKLTISFDTNTVINPDNDGKLIMGFSATTDPEGVVDTDFDFSGATYEFETNGSPYAGTLTSVSESANFLQFDVSQIIDGGSHVLTLSNVVNGSVSGCYYLHILTGTFGSTPFNIATNTVRVGDAEGCDDTEDEVIIPDDPAPEDDVPEEPYVERIDDVSKYNNAYTMVYNDQESYNVQAFPGTAKTRYAYNTDHTVLLVTNGKFIRAFYRGELVAEERVNTYVKSIDNFRFKVAKFYDDKNYDTVMLLSTNDSEMKLTTFRLTVDHALANKKIGLSQYTKRDYLHLTVDTAVKQIIAEVGASSEKHKTVTYKLTTKGSLIKQ